MISDPIGDMIARIKNAVQRKHEQVVIPLSKIKLEVVGVLKHEGYNESYEFVEKDKKGEIVVTLKYLNGSSPIREIKRISKPGVRNYIKKNDIPLVLQGMGISIISTPKGIMSGHKARKLGLGGELLCLVW